MGDSFRQAGLDILEWTEFSVAVTYHDIGAVVYELLHVPWSVVDFDLNRYRERLFRLHRRVQAEGGFRTCVYTNLIEARTHRGDCACRRVQAATSASTSEMRSCAVTNG